MEIDDRDITISIFDAEISVLAETVSFERGELIGTVNCVTRVSRVMLGETGEAIIAFLDEFIGIRRLRISPRTLKVRLKPSARQAEVLLGLKRLMERHVGPCADTYVPSFTKARERVLTPVLT